MLHGFAAEVRREQFSKAELDHMGYPTNTVMAAELGRCEAKRDLTNGLVRLPFYGLPTMELGETFDILWRKYGVKMYPLGGCVVTSGLTSYAEGYSEVARKFIEAEHGTNIWRTVRNDVTPPPAKSSTTTVPSLNRREYRIRTGDTLTRIALEHGVALKSLTEANHNLEPTRLKIGQIIFIPEQSKR